MVRYFQRSAVAGLVWCLVQGSARADPPPDPKHDPTPVDIERAREIFRNGESLYTEGSYDGAIAAFRRAYQLSGEPNCLYNIALAYGRIDEFDAAIEYLQYYRAFVDEAQQADIVARIEGLQRRKDKTQERAAQERAAQERAAQEQEAKPELDAPPRADTPPPPARVFGPGAIATTVIGVVGIGVGAGLGVASLSSKDDAASRCGFDDGDTRFCPGSAQDSLRRARGLAIGADVSFAVGTISVVTAIALVATAARRNRRALAFVAPTPGGALVRVTF